MDNRNTIRMPDDLEELVRWRDNWIQALLRDFWDFPGRQHRDRMLAIALHEMSPILRERFYANMSKRTAVRYRRLAGDLTGLSPTETDEARKLVLEEARSTIVRLIKTSEQVNMIYPDIPVLGQENTVPERPGAQPVPLQEELTMHLSGPPISGRSAEELVPLFRALSRQIRRTGLLSIEDIVETRIDDEFMKEGLRLIVDGEPPAMVREILQVRIRKIHKNEPRLTFIAAAITALGEGRSPERVEERCQLHLQESSPP